MHEEFLHQEEVNQLRERAFYVEKQCRGNTFGGPLFQIHSPHLVTPRCAKHTKQPCKFIYYKPSCLKGFCWSWSKGVGREKRGLILVRMSLTLCNFKVTWNKFKCLFCHVNTYLEKKGHQNYPYPVNSTYIYIYKFHEKNLKLGPNYEWPADKNVVSAKILYKITFETFFLIWQSM